MPGPQTAREALIAELLGDVDVLLKKAESLPGAMEAAANLVAAKIETSGDKFRNNFGSETDNFIKKLQPIATEAQKAANVVDSAAKKFILLAFIAGLIGGTIGGSLAGLVLYYYLLG